MAALQHKLHLLSIIFLFFKVIGFSRAPERFHLGLQKMQDVNSVWAHFSNSTIRKQCFILLRCCLCSLSLRLQVPWVLALDVGFWVCFTWKLSRFVLFSTFFAVSLLVLSTCKLGRIWKVGIDHWKIFLQERLEREYNLSLITTAPSVVYRVNCINGETVNFLFLNLLYLVWFFASSYVCGFWCWKCGCRIHA